MSDGITDMMREQEDSRNWTEDYCLENGKYYNRCSECGETFLGYKRRRVCKLCAQPHKSKAQ